MRSNHVHQLTLFAVIQPAMTGADQDTTAAAVFVMPISDPEQYRKTCMTGVSERPLCVSIYVFEAGSDQASMSEVKGYQQMSVLDQRGLECTRNKCSPGTCQLGRRGTLRLPLFR
jgi:hypothetical protein